jgi:hypothetical protein
LAAWSSTWISACGENIGVHGSWDRIPSGCILRGW